MIAVEDPAVRNLLTTQSYHELLVALDRETAPFASAKVAFIHQARRPPGAP